MRYLLILFVAVLLVSCSKPNKNDDTTSSKGNILFVVSNQDTYGATAINAANHFAEIVYAYDVLIKENYNVDFVSPDGGAIPIGYLQTSDTIQKQYLYNADFMSKLKTTFKPSDIDPDNYKAVYYGGGGSAMFGVPEDEKIQHITTSIYTNKGVVSAICHGTAGLVNVKDTEGNYLYTGKEINGFPDLFENKEAEYYKTFPFSIEEIIKQRGGNFSYSDKGWDNYYKVDGRLITGQDPTAATSVAKEIVKALENKY